MGEVRERMRCVGEAREVCIHTYLCSVMGECLMFVTDDFEYSSGTSHLLKHRLTS